MTYNKPQSVKACTAKYVLIPINRRQFSIRGGYRVKEVSIFTLSKQMNE